MKRCLLLCLFGLLSLLAKAQPSKLIEIDDSSFRPVQVDVMTGVTIDKILPDPSRRPCARIKIHIDRMTQEDIEQLSVRPIGGSVTVTKSVLASQGNGLVVELTAKEQTRFYLHHDRYGDSNEVSLNLQGGKEYRLEASLNTTYSIVVQSNVQNATVYLDDLYKGDITENLTLTIRDVYPGRHVLKVVENDTVALKEVTVSSSNVFFVVNLNRQQKKQFLYIEVVPSDAVLEIDGNIVATQNGIYHKLLPLGKYNYRVSRLNYHDAVGVADMSDLSKTHRQKVDLKPAFGWLSINALKQEGITGATVYVDEKPVGQIPIDRLLLNSGKYKIRIVQPLYEIYNVDIIISDEEAKVLSPVLVPNFSDVTIKTALGASIYVNNEEKGTSTWSGRLEVGSYEFESRKAGHVSSKIVYDVTSKDKTITIPDPKPIYGALVITSDPLNAKVFIDGKYIGDTPKYISNHLVGQYEMRVEKEGYITQIKSVVVAEGRDEEVAVNLVRKANYYSETENKKRKKTSYFVLTQVSAPSLAYGAMFGFSFKGWGAYANFRSNYTSVDEKYYCLTNNKLLDGMWFDATGATKCSNLMSSAGLLFFVHKSISLYGGVGYGYRRLYWQHESGDWAKVVDWSYDGACVELGSIFCWNWFAASVGVTTINFKTISATCGIGVRF